MSSPKSSLTMSQESQFKVRRFKVQKTDFNSEQP